LKPIVSGPAQALLRLLPILGVCALLNSCMTTAQPSAADEYLEVLRSRPGANLQGSAEQKALAAFRGFLTDLRGEETRKRTGEVYAADAYFNDTLKTKIGADAIRTYFDATADNTRAIRVVIDDVVRSGSDYYLRWTMEIEFAKFHRGKVFRTVGMTHARFNESGRVILHQDYWDSTAGFFEHVPVLGAGIRHIKSLL
jgi:hypothetical protein